MALPESVEPKERAAPIRPSFRAERKLFREGFLRVAGVDEAGRGPLAGPVVAAAVVLDPKHIPKGIADSKMLTADAREEIFATLCETADISFAFGSVAAIDRINILQATLVAMRRAVAAAWRSRPTPCSSTATSCRRECRARRGRSSAATRRACRSPPPRSSPRSSATG